MTVRPPSLVIAWAVSRATVSPIPPGAYGTMIVRGGSAAWAKASVQAHSTAPAIRFSVVVIPLSPRPAVLCALFFRG
ncbi:hypothetical protein G6F23_015013 [Rhizopus arrhizus]|nr:hypothetical protein G6F23_015013 [Rhizopus arrhizus]